MFFYFLLVLRDECGHLNKRSWQPDKMTFRRKHRFDPTTTPPIQVPKLLASVSVPLRQHPYILHSTIIIAHSRHAQKTQQQDVTSLSLRSKSDSRTSPENTSPPGKMDSNRQCTTSTILTYPVSSSRTSIYLRWRDQSSRASRQ